MLSTNVTFRVVCLSVCVLVTWICPAKTTEPIEMPFAGLTLVRPRNHVLDGGQDRTNLFSSARGDKSAMRPFARLLWTLVIIIIVIIKLLYSCERARRRDAEEAVLRCQGNRLRYRRYIQLSGAECDTVARVGVSTEWWVVDGRLRRWHGLRRSDGDENCQWSQCVAGCWRTGGPVLRRIRDKTEQDAKGY